MLMRLVINGQMKPSLGPDDFHTRQFRHRLAIFYRGFDETAEQRMARHRPRFKLRVKLATKKPRMALELHDLDQVAVRRQAAKDHASGAKFHTVSVVEFVAVTVALGDLFAAIQLG